MPHFRKRPVVIEEFTGEKFGITMSDLKSFSDKTKSMYIDGKWSKNA